MEDLDGFEYLRIVFFVVVIGLEDELVIVWVLLQWVVVVGLQWVQVGYGIYLCGVVCVGVVN